MGINIGICETEAPSAPCGELRGNIVKVHLEDPSGFEEHMEYDVRVDLETAKEAVGDWDAFIKRNRINPETDAVYMDKVKKDDDRALLEPLAQRVCTGWIVVEGLPEDVRRQVLEKSGSEDRLTGWDMLSFDEMNEMCANCPLSWDKGRGCIGAFDVRQLPPVLGQGPRMHRRIRARQQPPPGDRRKARMPHRRIGPRRGEGGEEVHIRGRGGAPERSRRPEGGASRGGQDDGQALQRPRRQDGGRGQNIRLRGLRVLLLLRIRRTR